MFLVRKLLSALHDGFGREPLPVPVITISHTNPKLTLMLDSPVLSINKAGAEQFSLDLTGETLTVDDVADALIGYFPSLIITDNGQGPRPARTIIAVETLEDNGRLHITLFTYSSLTWTLLDTFSRPLEAAKRAIGDMLEQLYLHSSEDIWLDEWGGYFGIRRENKEVDADYLDRIMREILKPKCNNVAIELALSNEQALDLTITDDPEAQGVFNACLPYNLLSSKTPLTFVSNAVVLINKIKAAGTKLGSVRLIGSTLADTVKPATDTAGIELAKHHYYNGQYKHKGLIQYQLETHTEILHD